MISRLYIVSVCLVSLVLLSCGYAYAIPAFARREGVTRQMCHFRLPELNNDGHEYARRGLREDPPGLEMNMDPSEQKHPDMNMAPAKPTEMPGMPTAGRHPQGQPINPNWPKYITVMGHHTFSAETHTRPVFDAGGLDLWVAGHLDAHWTGLANPSLNLRNGSTAVDQAYGQYITHWADRFGSGRVGQLLPFAILFNQGGPKMPLSDPLILSIPADTGYGWTPESFVRGLELGAVDLKRATAYLGIGQPKLEGTILTDQPGFERHTDFYGTGEWLFTPNGDSLTVYGYQGSAWLSPAAPDRSFHRVGFFGNVSGPSTKATLGFLTGSDEDAAGRSLDNTGYFALVEQLLSNRWAAYLRYDHLKRDLSTGRTQTLSGPAIGVSWWAQTQVRLTLEGQFLSISGENSDNRVMTELLWAL